MMASFNSTSRFYKDLLQQLEEHALSSRRCTDDESSGEHSLEPREPTSLRNSQQHQQRVSDPDEGILQTPRDSPQKRQQRKGSSESRSRMALKNSPRQYSSSASPSPFFEPNRYLRKRTRQPRAHQKPKSPVTRSTDLTLSTFKASGPNLETTLPPSEKAPRDLDDSEENHIVVPRLIRPTAGNVYNMNALPRIAEDRPLELSGTISGTKDSFTVLRSRLSMSTEYLGSTAPRDVTIGEPESDRSDQSSVQESVARKLKPSTLSPYVQKAKHKDVGPSRNRIEKSQRIGDNWATRDPEGERTKSIALSKALLAKFSRSAAPSDESGDRNAPEPPRAANMQAAASDSSSNFDDSGVIVNAVSRLEDGGGNGLYGANTLGEMPTNEDNTSKTGTATHSPRHSGLSRRPIIARRRGFLRATPSPLVKSRSAIRAQHLKVMTPAQLLRRMNKTLLGTSKAPALPKSITRNVDYSSISSIKAPSLFSGTSTSTKANSTPVGNALNEQDCGSREGTISTKKLMPPPPTPDPNFPMRYVSKLISTAGAAVKRSAPIRSTEDSGGKESLSTGDRGDGREAGEHASIQEDLEGTSSRLSSKRVRAPSIAYKLPSLRE
ncbi:hypothetical protein BGZ75_007120 [Mortierella antarctica]|nr:hypothetical protein BGZ75_007120 [Mortierella antarctica]